MNLTPALELKVQPKRINVLLYYKDSRINSSLKKKINRFKFAEFALFFQQIENLENSADRRYNHSGIALFS